VGFTYAAFNWSIWITCPADNEVVLPTVRTVLPLVNVLSDVVASDPGAEPCPPEPLPPRMLKPLRTKVVAVGPAPRSTTELRFVKMFPVRVKVPLGTRTTVDAVAEVSAALMFVTETFVLDTDDVQIPAPELFTLQYNRLQAAVVQFDQPELGTPPEIPALVQSTARAGSMTPDHSCENAIDEASRTTAMVRAFFI
jgi:hypothetical protein